MKTTYKGIEVYKLNCWQQGPVLLQALNILEGIDLKSMGYNSPKYIHTLYQVMNLAYADRDFYYGDPYVPPEEPMKGLLSKEYAAERRKLINWEKNDTSIKPGDPYPFQGGVNPYKDLLEKWRNTGAVKHELWSEAELAEWHREFTAGTTSVQAADEKGWVVSVTPSGGWNPACIAGNTGIGMSQRMQAFVLDRGQESLQRRAPRATAAFHAVAEPGPEGRQTLSLLVHPGRRRAGPALPAAFSEHRRMGRHGPAGVRSPGHHQRPDAEHLRLTRGHSGRPEGRCADAAGHHQGPGPVWATRCERLQRNSGPMNSIFFDWKHGSFWAGSSNNGEDYGIAWKP